MAFTKLSGTAPGDTVAYISQLDPEPNDVGGMSASDLQAEFDKAGCEIQTFLNSSLISELEGTGGAGNIGITPITGVTAGTVQEALSVLKTQLNGVTQGAVPDGSIGEDQLGTGAVTNAKLGAKAVKTVNLDDAAVTAGQLATDAVETAKIKDANVTTDKLAGAAVTGTKIGSGAVGTAHLAADLVVPVAKGGTGATDASTARSNLGVQGAISAVTVTLDKDEWGGIKTQAVTVTGISSASKWLAGPASKNDWKKAAEVTLYPPSVTAVDEMTFTCEETPDADIDVTVYFW